LNAPLSLSPLDALLDRLLGLHPRRIELSLGRIERLLDALGNPERRLPPVIHVAGTNGKGSAIAFMRAMLEADGRRVHVYTSPHLIRFNERIRLGGKLVDDARLIDALDRCEAANDGAPITFFEFTTAAAFLLFSDVPADHLLLEVGLGGRLDATNVVARPAATAITPVSIDHPEFLGTTLPEIAFEKAGILKRGVPALVGVQKDAALSVIEAQAAKIGAPLRLAGQDFTCREEHGRLIFEDEQGLLDLPLPRLRGRHQHQNAALALAVVRQVVPTLPQAAVEAGLRDANWPARLQRLDKGPLVAMAPPGAELWLDGGHNEDGGRILAQALADFEDSRPRPLLLIVGSLRSKDTTGFLRPFKGLAQEVLAVAVPADHAGRPPFEVSAAAAEVGIPSAACPNVPAALTYLAGRPWAAAPRILIAGSLYLAGEVLKLNGTEVA
jgi:dihydrofolate synthase/folylpolyglutamate synthase